MDIGAAHGPGSNSLATARATTPGTPPPPGSTPAASPDPTLVAGYTALTVLSGVLGFIFLIMFSYGAAKLSFDKYRSFGWAFLDFIFSSFYYPYYAIFLNSPTYIGGRR